MACRRPLAVLALVVGALTGAVAAQSPPAGAPSCGPVDGVRFVCGLAGPEDLAQIPGTRWLIASSFAGEGLSLVDTRASTAVKFYPTPAAADRLDARAYPACPGPPVTTPRFRTHGLYLAGKGGRFTLYAISHGPRESVEVFQLDARGAAPTIAWVGCVVAPDPIGLNSVVALPDGGLVATNFQSRAPAGRPGGGFQPALINGENNGELWEWHAASGWAKVPGSESAGANGVELSSDGRWFYIAQWGNRTLARLSRGATPPRRDVLDLGFRVDNVRWAPDGTLLVAGQGGPDCAVVPQGRGQGPREGPGMSVIGRVDPRRWTYTSLVQHPTSPVIAAATVAVQVDGRLWSGSFAGDRLAIYPVPNAR